MMDDAPIKFASSPFMNCPGKEKFIYSNHCYLLRRGWVIQPSPGEGKTWKSQELVPERAFSGKLGGNGRQRAGYCTAGKPRKSFHKYLFSKNIYL